MSDADTRTVTICGSTRFRDQINWVNSELTLMGYIVLAPGVFVRSDPAYSDLHDTEAKDRLDALHLRKIDMSDGIYVVAPNGYIGESTQKEIDYASTLGIDIFIINEFPENKEGA